MDSAELKSYADAIEKSKSSQSRFWIIAVSWLLVMGLVSFYFISVITDFERRADRMENEQTAQLYKVSSLESRLVATIPLINELEQKRMEGLDGQKAMRRARVLGRNFVARAKLLEAQEIFLRKQINIAASQDSIDALYLGAISDFMLKDRASAVEGFRNTLIAIDREAQAVQAENASSKTGAIGMLEADRDNLRLAALAGLARGLQLERKHVDAIEKATELIELIKRARRENQAQFKATADRTLYDPLAEAYSIRAFSEYKRGLELQIAQGSKKEAGGFYDSSAEDCAEAEKLDEHYWVPIHYLGFAHFLRGDNTKAANAWKAASRKRMSTKEVAGSIENIGLAYLSAGDWKSALQNTELVLLVHPKAKDSPWNALFQGIALTKLNRMEEANRAFAIWKNGSEESDAIALKQYLGEDFHQYIDSAP